MNPFKAAAIAFSTYSVIPMPRFIWREQEMHCALAAMPLVGIVLGAVFSAWAYVCIVLDFSPLLYSAVAVFIPVAITGGIHLDGFCDVSDALASHQSREKKLVILKDSHIGAFAAIKCSVYLLLQFGLYCQLGPEAFPAVAVCFVLSRSLSALLSAILPKARGEGMLVSYTGGGINKPVAVLSSVCAALFSVLIMVLSPVGGTMTVLFLCIWCFKYKLLSAKNFGGVTGDTAGYFLQMCELLAPACLVLGSVIERYI